jgi:L,D-transpeptidase ErfK/SrfK
MEGIQRISSPYPVHPDSSLERNTFPIVEGSDVIGRFAFIRLREGDTLPDIARHFSLGLGEISAANPGVDVWVPRAGERIMLPLRFILRMPRERAS